MTLKMIFRIGSVLLGTLLGLSGCGHDGGPSGVDLAASRAIAVPFDPTNFVGKVDNPYFPLTPGTVYSYVAQTVDGVETSEVTVTHAAKEILGVAATVVHDRVLLNGSLTEDTFDWYAQDKAGNVWYLGEDTKQFENGVLVGTVGSWEAGKDGAAAGIIMLAHPRIGDTYQQENSPGVVADRARVLSLGETVSVPFGSFDECLKTLDWTPLEPGVREFKFYAPGVGLVLEVSPRGGRERVELTGLSRP